MQFMSKTSSLQAYHILLYRKALHPEFFGALEGRKRVVHGDYEFEAWIFRGGHVLLFRHDGQCAVEVVTERPEALPDRSLVTALPCAGEKDQEETLGDKVEYVSSVQTETLSDHLYVGTFGELADHARDNDTLSVTWNDESGRSNLSLIDLQRYHDELHVQAYHLRTDCGLVLRSQTIFRAAAVKS